jgi:hypothetical protein
MPGALVSAGHCYVRVATDLISECGLGQLHVGRKMPQILKRRRRQNPCSRVRNWGCGDPESGKVGVQAEVRCGLIYLEVPHFDELRCGVYAFWQVAALGERPCRMGFR